MWILTNDGRMINLDHVQDIVVVGTVVEARLADGREIRLGTFDTQEKAQGYLVSLFARTRVRGEEDR